MNGRGRLLVNMAIEKNKDDVSLNVPSEYEELQLPLNLSMEGNLQISTDQSNQETHIASSNTDVPIPSTSKLELVKNKAIDYYISPIHSDESDFDDSDADPNFVFPDAEKTKPSKAVLSSSSSSSSVTSNSSSSSTSKNSSSSSEKQLCW